MNIKLAIFDLDGTTLDTLQDLADAVNHALRAQGLAEHTADEVRSYIGNGIRNLIDRSVPADTPEEVTALVFAAFKSYYAMHCKDKTCPYPGVGTSTSTASTFAPPGSFIPSIFFGISFSIFISLHRPKFSVYFPITFSYSHYNTLLALLSIFIEHFIPLLATT